MWWIVLLLIILVLQHLIFYKYEYDWEDSTLGTMKIIGSVLMIIFIYIMVYQAIRLQTVLLKRIGDLQCLDVVVTLN